MTGIFSEIQVKLILVDTGAVANKFHILLVPVDLLSFENLLVIPNCSEKNKSKPVGDAGAASMSKGAPSLPSVALVFTPKLTTDSSKLPSPSVELALISNAQLVITADAFVVETTINKKLMVKIKIISFNF